MELQEVLAEKLPELLDFSKDLESLEVSTKIQLKYLAEETQAKLVVKLVTTTKLKSACNLGVWCISVQQIDASILATHFRSLLLAIIHWERKETMALNDIRGKEKAL
ncbi:hypothetical protein QN277_005105 [Acacia crassicarpa]|uniref:Uncharacterized protein n=1 Tax=Acacia crassicarpa TaxID=499986 RepID=A0AAE1M9G0_9FABA|nr:hypothetical protein QN277_005105 [Acacia crassicarpa]